MRLQETVIFKMSPIEVRELKFSSMYTRNTLAVKQVREASDIKNELSRLEQDLCDKVLERIKVGHLVNPAELKGKAPGGVEIYACPQGLKMEVKVDQPAELVRCTPWIVQHSEAYQGIQLMVGLAATVLEEQVVWVPKKMETGYHKFHAHGITNEAMMNYARKLSGFTRRQSSEDGRHKVLDTFYQAFSTMEYEEYLAYQFELALGPFSSLFEWKALPSEQEVSETDLELSPIVRVRSPQVLLRPKAGYEHCFFNAMDTVTPQFMKRFNVLSYIPVWVAPLPEKKILLPEFDPFTYVSNIQHSSCLLQNSRSYEEDSVWAPTVESCGVSGRKELQLNKYLTVIMAQVFTKRSGQIILQGFSCKKAVLLIRQIEQWITQSDPLLKTCPYFFVLKDTSYVHQVFPKRTITESASGFSGNLVIVDRSYEQVEFLSTSHQCYESARHFLREVNYQETCQKEGVDFIIFTRTVNPYLWSSVWGLKVYPLLMSNHFDCLLSTLTSLAMVGSDGSWAFSLQYGDYHPLDYESFLVKAYEDAASVIDPFFGAKYTFCPQTNLLRRMPGFYRGYEKYSLYPNGCPAQLEEEVPWNGRVNDNGHFN